MVDFYFLHPHALTLEDPLVPGMQIEYTRGKKSILQLGWNGLSKIIPKSSEVKT